MYLITSELPCFLNLSLIDKIPSKHSVYEAQIIIILTALSACSFIILSSHAIMTSSCISLCPSSNSFH